ncbi:MAG: type II toxin-antitoxin system MqsA family antitoxin [Acidimicrobiia bacterium]
MKCVLCRNGETRPGLADKAFSHDGMTLVIKDVPAEICENCGERYFDAEVTRELLRIARAAASEGVVVDVRRYVAA